MKYEADTALGIKVHAHLKSLNIETPFKPTVPNAKVIADHFAAIMQEMGLDLTDDSLQDTPKRFAKMYATEIFYGLDYDNFPKATVVENKMHYNEMVLERNITVHSTCEHHTSSIIGKAFVAYIPNQKVLGLSKLNRIVDFFSRRPQIQERLTAQIHATLKFILETENVAVVIQAEHMCVKLRGVQDACSDTVTSQLSGDFLKPAVRAEFFSLAKGLS